MLHVFVKNVAIDVMPTAAKTQAVSSPDAWVENRQPEAEPTKRLTLDIPPGLHARIKAACAMRGTKMVDEIRGVLEAKFSQG